MITPWWGSFEWIEFASLTPWLATDTRIVSHTLGVSTQMTAQPLDAVCRDGELFYRNGWMVGTAGNLSLREDADSFWITASGRPKGELTPRDFLRVGLDGVVLQRQKDDDKPSAETAIHQVLYRHFGDAGAIYHVHSVEAMLVSLFTDGDAVRLPPIEMIKGFDIWEQTPEVDLWVLENTLQVPRIAEELDRRLQSGKPRIPAVLIRRHGITVWGRTPLAARHSIELIEFVFRYMVAERRLAGLGSSGGNA
jgi:methylthioribulose-1-phosphate dehydratase